MGRVCQLAPVGQECAVDASAAATPMVDLQIATSKTREPIRFLFIVQLVYTV